MINAPSIWISGGETSGDLHGQILTRALRQLCPEIHIAGMAGPAMRLEGVTAPVHTESLSVMGFTEVLGQLPKIMRILQTIRTELSARRPDAVVLIDAPDFHFRVAKMAHSLNIPVVYYISPKLWAWREGRVAFLKKHVSRLVSILPFEVDFYARHGMDIDYVGHPLLDVVRTPQILAMPEIPQRIGILPGSRHKEISALLPIFSRAAQLLSGQFPGLEFVLPVAPGMNQALIRQYWHAKLPVTLLDSSNRYEIMRSCRAIMAASGTATLETALLGKPTAVAYKFSALSHALGKLLVNVPYISLPNLILNTSVFPEFLQSGATAWAIAAAVARWIPDGPARDTVTRSLDTLPRLLGEGNAARRAAAIVLKTTGMPATGSVTG